MTNALVMGFVMGWVGSMPLAGAVSIFVFQRGLAGRFRGGIVLAAGAALAESIWCLAAVIGAGRIISRWPGLEAAARTIGGLILLGLGFYFLWKRDILPAAAEKDRENGDTLRREFRLGFTLVAGNVSIPFTWLGMITIAVSWGFDPVAGFPWAFAAGVALGIMGWFFLLLKILTTLRTCFNRIIHERVMKVMGLLLLAAGTLTLMKVCL